MDFLPTDYTAPKSSNNYMKLQEGDNKIRILSKPVFGWEDWGPDLKPIRYQMKDKPLKSLDPKKPIRHFWSLIVWDYSDSNIKILHITQATIRSMIEALARNPDWGAPYNYDLTIHKKGTDLKSEYMVSPTPHKPVLLDIVKAFHDKPCNLNALFTGDDPFACLNEVTPAMFINDKQQEDKSKDNIITKEQLIHLVEISNEVSRDDFEKVMLKLRNEYKIERLSELPNRLYESVKPALCKYREEFRKNNKPFDVF